MEAMPISSASRVLQHDRVVLIRAEGRWPLHREDADDEEQLRLHANRLADWVLRPEELLADGVLRLRSQPGQQRKRSDYRALPFPPRPARPRMPSK
jgi:hypothetical protein